MTDHDVRRLAGARRRSGAASGRGAEAGASPDGPTELPGHSWWGVLKRTAKEFQQDKLTDWAAALTYYAVLSIFPALLAAVSLLGLFGESATQPLIDNLGALAPGPAREILHTVLVTLQNSQRGAGVATIIGIAVALWSASGYVAAFMRAANIMYEMPEGRPIWKTLPLRLAITTVLVILTAAGAVAVVFTGDLARRAGDVLGLGETAVAVWNIAKWPVLVIAVMLVLALLYWLAPNVAHPGFRWITPGSALAVVLWIVASLGFGFYVANFGSYAKTYAALAGVVVFLVWLWITNITVLLGVEFDAELARARAIEDGHPPEEEPYVEPRDTRKMDGE
ncbi:YihY/virulence factor BrkB family protein [Planomonospora sp. ID67723]|uniref:YihY/virulence factor BrkB family protein n=1 Tax=Planomonospora sp. ID67723 TaxID=2738134 RepID=UPI0018C44394|nr:YihY/virulence factor BrkB family protein [Planomonospora sp. ID67723]MBG0826369.1 YihY/virulence factor BrkB family protein [Planomonospora sp. ID67723]